MSDRDELREEVKRIWLLTGSGGTVTALDEKADAVIELVWNAAIEAAHKVVTDKTHAASKYGATSDYDIGHADGWNDNAQSSGRELRALKIGDSE